jgi:NitT/TauT family transport system substrate-binding protein
MKPELVARLSMRRLPEVVDPDTVTTTVKLMKDNSLITADMDVRGMTDPGAMK